MQFMACLWDVYEMFAFLKAGREHTRVMAAVGRVNLQPLVSSWVSGALLELMCIFDLSVDNTPGPYGATGRERSLQTGMDDLRSLAPHGTPHDVGN